ncbi:toprim domain-containing protein [Streptococcus pneumoniae]|nr:toprim domain-containing protein [Streptococcus pneumoniae]CIO90722.1 DNA primase [Streptococcus pneumoniae]CIW91656.1 DNA primase [Streptococcus pneumoniae]CIY56437.1 DNA primase [Streptococcus pneumoniae]CKH91007.1 DNA primase [Streptococcus pneumoniae]COB21077.1 DNA primase [Streptococcus pneumoniae]
MVLSKEEAKRLSIISVAEQLGMELKRTGSYSYNWVEHDSFVIDTKKNEFYWNSRTEFGDVIQLVQTIRGVSYKEAMHFLETGEFKEVDVEAQTASKEPFSYHLERYERQDFSDSRRYLKAQRGLSDDTINFFISQGSIAEAIRKKGDYFEPVIVFKYKDNTGFLAGASLQGIVENREYYPERGHLKQIMRNSDGQLGFSIDIGNPKRLVFAEAPIDLMSYYELHKDRLQDVRLVAMDGVKEGTISRRFMELYAEINDKSYQINQNTGKALEVVARTTNYFKDGQHQDMITLAVDNDMAGHNFITSLQEKGIPVQIEIPPILQKNQYKEDWNDFLKGGNKFPKELAHVYTVDEKSWHYQGSFEKEIALGKAQELTADDVKAFVSDRQLTREEVRQEYQTIINQERGRKNSMSELHENSSDHEDDLVNSHKQADRVLIQPETQAIIDSGEVKQWAKYPNIYFVKGLRQVALELTEDGKFEQSSQYLPKTEEEKEVVNKLLSKQKDQGELVLEDDQSSELNIDTSNLSPEDAEWLKKNWNNISFSVEPKKQMVIDSDKTVTFEKPSDPVGDTYEAQEQIQSTEKTPESTQEQMNDRASGGEGYSQPDAVGSAEPEAESSATFEQTVTSHPTSPYRYLQFSTNFEEVQRRYSKYHPITQDDLKK